MKLIKLQIDININDKFPINIKIDKKSMFKKAKKNQENNVRELSVETNFKLKSSIQLSKLICINNKADLHKKDVLKISNHFARYRKVLLNNPITK